MLFWKKPKRHDFSYLANKFSSAPFSSDPFRHVYIADLFEPHHFRAIVNDPQIRVKAARNDEELIDLLHEAAFKEISFPGTTTDIGAYLGWHRDRANSKVLNHDTCEGFGVTMRLQSARENSVVEQLLAFLASDSFWSALYDKFAIDRAATYTDMGIQKYLDGYEISPHPDVRKKALTFMVNINPSTQSAALDYHTHYMTFASARDYVREFWRDRPEIERCWVPWSWCETRKQQTKNNSMVIFAPGNDTLHAVRAAYNHLPTQRSQIYGNIWFKDVPMTSAKWQDLPKGFEATVPVSD